MSSYLDYKGRVQLLVSTLYKLGTLDICRRVKGEPYSQNYIDLANKYKKEITPNVTTIVWNPVNTKERDFGFPTSLREKYSYDGKIGEVGFRKVYRVINNKSGQKSVIKIIDNENEYEGHSFLNEVVTWKYLRHTNIVEFRDANI